MPDKQKSPECCLLLYLINIKFVPQPLFNIHDLCVHSSARRRGVARDLLREIEARARALGCSKITLEVLADGSNEGARALYASEGYGSNMAFMEKKIPAAA